MNRRHRVARTWRTKVAPYIRKKCSCGLVVSANSRADATARFRQHQQLWGAEVPNLLAASFTVGMRT